MARAVWGMKRVQNGILRSNDLKSIIALIWAAVVMAFFEDNS